MSWYLSRTDGELVALARQGNRPARAVLVERTLLPASRVAMHLEPNADAAVASLVAAYRDTFRRVVELADDEAFLPVLLERLDHRAPFPLDPATHAPLDPADRHRVRAAVLGVDRRRRAVPLVAVLATSAVVALTLSSTASPPAGPVVDDAPPAAPPATEPPPVTDAPTPTGSPTRGDSTSSEDAEATGDAPSGGAPSEVVGTPTEAEPGGTSDGGTGTGELAETR